MLIRVKVQVSPSPQHSTPAPRCSTLVRCCTCTSHLQAMGWWGCGCWRGSCSYTRVSSPSNTIRKRVVSTGPSSLSTPSGESTCSSPQPFSPYSLQHSAISSTSPFVPLSCMIHEHLPPLYPIATHASPPSSYTLSHPLPSCAFPCPSYRFLAGPVVILISNHVIDKWVREKVVNGVDLAITLQGHLFFLVGDLSPPPLLPFVFLSFILGERCLPNMFLVRPSYIITPSADTDSSQRRQP